MYGMALSCGMSEKWEFVDRKGLSPRKHNLLYRRWTSFYTLIGKHCVFKYRRLSLPHFLFSTIFIPSVAKHSFARIFWSYSIMMVVLTMTCPPLFVALGSQRSDWSVEYHIHCSYHLQKLFIAYYASNFSGTREREGSALLFQVGWFQRFYSQNERSCSARNALVCAELPYVYVDS